MGDKVLLKLSLWKEVVRLGKNEKFSPRYIDPYEFQERIGPAAYRLALPTNLSWIQDIFYVSILRKCVLDPTHVLEKKPVQIKENLSFEEEPVQILDRKEQVLRNKTVPYIKFIWRNHGIQEATWENKDQ